MSLARGRDVAVGGRVVWLYDAEPTDMTDLGVVDGDLCGSLHCELNIGLGGGCCDRFGSCESSGSLPLWDSWDENGRGT